MVRTVARNLRVGSVLVSMEIGWESPLSTLMPVLLENPAVLVRSLLRWWWWLHIPRHRVDSR